METRLTLRLPSALLTEVDAEAAAAGVTRSELIRWRLERRTTLGTVVAAEAAAGLASLAELEDGADDPVVAAWLSGAAAALRAVASWEEVAA